MCTKLRVVGVHALQVVVTLRLDLTHRPRRPTCARSGHREEGGREGGKGGRGIGIDNLDDTIRARAKGSVVPSRRLLSFPHATLCPAARQIGRGEETRAGIRRPASTSTAPIRCVRGPPIFHIRPPSRTCGLREHPRNRIRRSSYSGTGGRGQRATQATQARRICASSHEDEVGTYAPHARRRGEDGPIYERAPLQRASLANAIGWKGRALRSARFPFWGHNFSSTVRRGPALRGRCTLRTRRSAATSGAHPASTIVRSCGLQSVDTPETMFAADGAPSYSGICGAYPTRNTFAFTPPQKKCEKVFATRPKMSAWTGAGVCSAAHRTLALALALGPEGRGESVHRGGRVWVGTGGDRWQIRWAGCLVRGREEECARLPPGGEARITARESSVACAGEDEVGTYACIRMHRALVGAGRRTQLRTRPAPACVFLVNAIGWRDARFPFWRPTSSTIPVRCVARTAHHASPYTSPS
ncbi:hypothetical protein B0H13DRAFT_2373321 [Mycena leptocephala]|nr:hypothetical protein B0H13DRAFT_2373321 [Mycena leptocephala]